MSVKIVTNNFKRLLTFEGNQVKEFEKWKNEQRDKGAEIKFDKRNNIYCVGPTMDFEMYLNYVTFLNESYDSWLSYGYFDMGMVPYLMWPSFMDASPALEQMRKIARTAGVELIKVPSVSFLKHSYVSNGTDYWIFRDDLYLLCDYMRQAAPDAYPYNFASPEDACLSKFLEPLAVISKIQRGM